MCGGGGDTIIQQPTPVSAPSATASIQEYIANQPALFALQQQQAPLEAQQQVELLEEFGPQLGAAVKAGQEALAPETSAIQEELAATARERMAGGLSEEERAQFLSDFSGQLGTNIGSPIGALATSRSLQLASQQRQREGENLGLSLAGRQQLAQPMAPSTTNIAGSLTPGQVMGFNQGVYGTQAGMYNNQFNAFAQQSLNQQNQPSILGQVFGGVAGAATGALMGGFCWVAAEVFDGWDDPRTHAVRHYLLTDGPQWFVELYKRFGEKTASFISDKPILKAMFKKLFTYFAKKGGHNA